MESLVDFHQYHQRLDDVETIRVSGFVRSVIGTIIEAGGPRSAIGTLCRVFPRGENGREGTPMLAEVVGFDEDGVKLMPLHEMRNVVPGSRVERVRSKPVVRVGEDMLGRVLDPLGAELEDGPELYFELLRGMAGSLHDCLSQAG